jgi:O-antigen/teichoic acid export membrane protein
MGIIKTQTIKGSIYSYLGVIVGFVSTIFLRPHCLDTAQNGILELMLSFSAIIVQVASLGFQSAAIRFFPYFRDHGNKHNGFLFLSIVVSSIGFLLCFSVIELLDYYNYFDSSAYKAIFKQYHIVLWILSFFALFYGVFDNYNRVLYDAVTGTALKDFYQKFFVAVAMSSILVWGIDFQYFLYFWLLANALPLLILLIKIIKDKHLFVKPDLSILTPDLVKGLASVSAFAILSGFTTMVIQYIDKIMIGDLLGLSETGIYGITIYFATVIALPARIMYRIAGTVIADKWKTHDLEGIQSIYSKSCMNQLLIGLLLFIGIWGNINNVFHLLPEQYQTGKYVILFMGLGSLFDMATGVNGVILSTSKCYRYDTAFFIALIGVVIGTNYWLIPIYGITGAAMATSLSTLLFNLFRFLFVWIKFDMQPFSLNNVRILVIGGLTLMINNFIPELPNFIIDLLIRSSVMAVIYIGSIYLLRLSPEMNGIIESTIKKRFE